jgi:hypothetical protein
MNEFIQVLNVDSAAKPPTSWAAAGLAPEAARAAGVTRPGPVVATGLLLPAWKGIIVVDQCQARKSKKALTLQICV